MTPEDGDGKRTSETGLIEHANFCLIPRLWTISYPSLENARSSANSFGL